MVQKVAIVTGTSNEIGFSIALLLARNGFYTFATMSDSDESKDLTDIAKREKLPMEITRLDPSNCDSVNQTVDRISERRKQIDVLVNNAGYGLIGCFEDLSMEEIVQEFETNLFEIVRLTKSVLPVMRRQKYGIIINVGSIAGRIGYPAMSAYIASKFALSGLTESLRYEVDQFGIKVVLIEPGIIKTSFVQTGMMARKATDTSSPYSQLTQKVHQGLRFLSEKGTPLEEVEKVILKVVTSDEPRPRYLVGIDAAVLVEARTRMSDVEFENFIKKELGM